MVRSCAFTGHRPASFDFKFNENDDRCIALKEKLHDTITKLCFEGYRDFYCGMAEGVDIWAAESVLRLQPFFPGLNLFAVIPYRKHSAIIGTQYHARYERVLQQVTGTICICETYTQSCFKERNHYMVDHADTLVAVYDSFHQRSGTGQTVRYAQASGKRVIIIDPKDPV